MTNHNFTKHNNALMHDDVYFAVLVNFSPPHIGGMLQVRYYPLKNWVRAGARFKLVAFLCSTVPTFVSCN